MNRMTRNQKAHAKRKNAIIRDGELFNANLSEMARTAVMLVRSICIAISSPGPLTYSQAIQEGEEKSIQIMKKKQQAKIQKKLQEKHQ